jgi:hypothetical protein
MDGDDQREEFRLFVGPPIPIEEYAAWAAQERARRATSPPDDDEVEFVSPRVSGRMLRGLPREGD